MEMASGDLVLHLQRQDILLKTIILVDCSIVPPILDIKYSIMIIKYSIMMAMVLNFVIRSKICYVPFILVCLSIYLVCQACRQNEGAFCMFLSLLTKFFFLKKKNKKKKKKWMG